MHVRYVCWKKNLLCSRQNKLLRPKGLVNPSGENSSSVANLHRKDYSIRSCQSLTLNKQKLSTEMQKEENEERKANRERKLKSISKH
ncbi:hypothetical protein GH733_013817 [Mirounga leonina]|nr:hypothetical protein GH733_013817 [Mirounga leonina]